MKNVFDAIASVYDSATNENHWEIALDHCVEFVGARSASLVVIENDPSLPMHVGRVSQVLRQLDGEAVNFYSQNLLQYERAGWEYILTLPNQTLVTDKKVWNQPDTEIIKREDFAFLLKHAGVLRRVAARLNNNKSWLDNIAFQFDKNISIVPAVNMESMQLLLPHMAKTIELGRAFTLLKSQYQAVLTALDHVGVGICIAIEDGTIIVANAEAERILDEKDGIVLDNQRKLHIPSALDTELALRGAIGEISATASGKPSKSECLFKVDRRSGRHSYLIELSPIRDTSAELEAGLHGALITIIDPANSGVVQIERLAKAYELTEAESKIARYLVDGWTNSDIAEDRNVSIDTIKTQVASIMNKTGAKRRSDIVRLALKASPPIKIAKT